MKPLRYNLTVAILSALACLLLLTWLLLSIISFKTAEKDLLSLKSEQGRVILTGFLDLFADAASNGSSEGPIVDRAAHRLAGERDFAGFILVDDRERPVYLLKDGRGVDSRLREVLSTGAETSVLADGGQVILRYAPLLRNERVVGAGRLALSLAGEYQRLQRSRRLFLAYFVIDFFLLFVFGSFLLRGIMVIPIRKLLAATQRITAGDYSHAVHVPGSAEIADLAASFNVMQHSLLSKREEVEAHVKSLEKANQALEAAREETVRSEKMASVGLLAAGMAHEIGTPLSAIIGYAGILADEVADDPERYDYVRRIGQEAGRIDRLVRELLDYARPKRAENERVDAGRLVAETFGMLGRQGIFRRIETSLQVAEEVPALFLDRHQFMQVLINLLINARDAMPEGGALTLTVTGGSFTTAAAPPTPPAAPHVIGRRRADFGGVFQARFQEGGASLPCVIIAVSDTGDGIAQEDLGKVFDPFFTTKEPGKGTGLGLAICARIVDSFGGRITVQSEPRKGTTFTVWLPVKNRAGGEE